jgi:hypothetical protein
MTDLVKLAIEEKEAIADILAIAQRYRVAGAGDCVGILDDLWTKRMARIVARHSL